MSKFSATVQISNDPLFLAEDGNRADLESYRENLEAHLSERFEGEVLVRTASVSRPMSDDAEVEAYVRELHQGDGWLSFL